MKYTLLIVFVFLLSCKSSRRLVVYNSDVMSDEVLCIEKLLVVSASLKSTAILYVYPESTTVTVSNGKREIKGAKIALDGLKFGLMAYELDRKRDKQIWVSDSIHTSNFIVDYRYGFVSLSHDTSAIRRQECSWVLNYRNSMPYFR